MGSTAATTTAKSADGGHLFALRGSFGAGCAYPALQVVWGTESCKAAPAAAPVVTKPTPAPVSGPRLLPGMGARQACHPAGKQCCEAGASRLALRHVLPMPWRLSRCGPRNPVARPPSCPLRGAGAAGEDGACACARAARAGAAARARDGAARGSHQTGPRHPSRGVGGRRRLAAKEGHLRSARGLACGLPSRAQSRGTSPHMTCHRTTTPVLGGLA